ncbi:hypothetical protein Cgig2_010272 [Carnegiea gigantea]|uniref:Uncharacterized protein n=1 Tax=Carnegiea gigantea TaxID=171969 RepID=A0A9Q1JR77_9CARY|nr:hypothetical protein Cgig2_010272 [Carnegiea gigantea]
MTSITGSYVVVLIDTRVGSRNTRRLLNEAYALNYHYREPLGFVGRVVILWDNFKVEVSGFTGHDIDMSCILKLRTPVNHHRLRYPERVNEVIDDLVHKHALESDWVLGDRNTQLWTLKDDMRIDAKRRGEVETLRKLLGVAIVVIAIRLAIGMRWMSA